MRIRKEVEKWSAALFLKLLLVLGILYNTFFLLAGYADGGDSLFEPERILFWALNGLLMPLMLSLTLSFSIRNASLFINDFQSITNFQEKLVRHISTGGFTVHQKTTEAIHFIPTSWYYKILKSWFGTENLKLTIGQEIILTGPLKKIATFEDILTWNEDFKS